jgi:hypothetical protein
MNQLVAIFLRAVENSIALYDDRRPADKLGGRTTSSQLHGDNEQYVVAGCE